MVKVILFVSKSYISIFVRVEAYSSSIMSTIPQTALAILSKTSDTLPKIEQTFKPN